MAANIDSTHQHRRCSSQKSSHTSHNLSRPMYIWNFDRGSESTCRAPIDVLLNPCLVLLKGHLFDSYTGNYFSGRMRTMNLLHLQPTRIHLPIQPSCMAKFHWTGPIPIPQSLTQDELIMPLVSPIHQRLSRPKPSHQQLCQTSPPVLLTNITSSL
ncbi:hypothetical protein L211DRAFT_351158 [Terfezia boudieri ATCC MYA-4762]|uniref:Uncharacterized protein n=1 Tax=Terfezia boudieri ATCC MYA-4762 TaxID=1051890 RepID=A0A3N4LL01_9PEZI|nr:hypothetical protein L211DRAFT_351158 [Terfezia boudieri ATCC MYA-4762]